MPNKKCFVPKCESRSNGKENLAHFRATDIKVRKLWEEAIGKTGMCLNSSVCSAHFEASCIIKMRGSTPLKNWRLRPGSIPTLNIPCSPANITASTTQHTIYSGQPEKASAKKIPSAVGNSFQPGINILLEDSTQPSSKIEDKVSESHKIPEEVTSPGLTTRNSRDDCAVVEGINSVSKSASELFIQLQETGSSKPQQSNSNLLTYLTDTLDINVASTSKKTVSTSLSNHMLDELKRQVPLPANEWFWLLNKNEKQALCSVFIPTSERMIIKTVVLTSPTSVSYLVNGKPVDANRKATFTSYADLACLLKKFHSKVVCEGIRDEAFNILDLTMKSAGTREADGTLRSKTCAIVTSNGTLCSKCKHYHECLKANKKNLLEKSSKGRLQVIRSLRRKVSHRDKIISELAEKYTKLTSDFVELKNEAKEKSIDNLMEYLRPVERSMVSLYKTRVAALKDGDPPYLNGLRYDESVAKHCGLLWIKSRSTYKFLRKNEIVPLPSLSWVSRYVKMKTLTNNQSADSNEAPIEGCEIERTDASDELSATDARVSKSIDSEAEIELFN